MPPKSGTNTSGKDAVVRTIHDDNHRINKRGIRRPPPKVYRTARVVPVITRSKTKAENDLVADLPTIQFFVKTLITGQNITIELPLSATVPQLNVLVQNRTGIPPDQQRLTFAGKQIGGNSTLADCGIDKEAMLHMVLRLTGS